MSFPDFHISNIVYDFFAEKISEDVSFQDANTLLKDVCGILTFFDSEETYFQFLKELSFKDKNLVSEDRIEYGDFQTNIKLAKMVVQKIASLKISPEIIIEPTCGKANFIIASLSEFNNIQHIIGIEIYEPYIWQTKFNILDFFLQNNNKNVPKIEIHHCSVFDFDFHRIKENISEKQLLIIGNPPWVTNSKLGSLSSSNLPQKTNFKNQSGIEAITGKGNFDIAEFITISLLKQFDNTNGYLAFLVKNSVIKNIIFEQKKAKYFINNIEKQNIDSKKEFNVSVEASLLFCQLNRTPGLICQESDFYSSIRKSKIGWVESKFVADVQAYNAVDTIDGICQFEWRQGVKHDCSQVMELEQIGNCFKNKIGDVFELENDLIFNILKSSDLKSLKADNTNRCTIITQKKVGQDTSYIKQLYPLTYNYLNSKLDYFKSRKSSIYNNKPPFSIFGIGDYSFAPYKVAISGLYKTFHFTLVLPQQGKPVMLDDTCYFLSFNKLEYAVYTLLLLNSTMVESFLKAISFPDAKRMITKDVLMRIDLYKLIDSISIPEIQNNLLIFNKNNNLNIDLSLWQSFIEIISKKDNQQMVLFET